MKNSNYVMSTVVFCLSLMCTVGAVFAKETAEQKRERIRAEKIKADANKSLVKVHYSYKKSDRPKFDDDYFSFSYDSDETLGYAMYTMTEVKTGVILDKKGRIFIEEDERTPDVIEKIIVELYDGTRLDAKKDVLLSHCPGQLLMVTGELPKTWTPVKFVDAPEKIDVKTKLYAAGLNVSDSHQHHNFSFNGTLEREEHISVTGVSQVKLRENTADAPDYLRPNGKQAAILYNEDAQAVGVTCSERIDLDDDAFLWRGKDILADPGVSLEGYEKKVEDVFSKYLYLVQVTFRPPPQDEEDDMGYFSRYFHSYSHSNVDSQEVIVYGLAFGPKKILVPTMLDKATMATVDMIEVQIDSSYYLGSFCGVFNELEASVIELNEERVKTTLPHYVSLDSLKELPRYEPFWAVFLRDLAGKDFWIKPCRWIDKNRGCSDQWYRIPASSIRQGSWLLTSDGQFAGLFTGMRMEFDRYQSYLSGEGHHYYGNRRFMYGRMGGSYYNRENQTRLYDGKTITEILKDCSNRYDRHIKHLDKDEQRRRCWLGVEFAEVTKEMAKQMDLRKQTYDGRIGLIVNRVYPDSPAVKIGLQEGDILLQLKVSSAPWPIDLKIGERDYDMPDWEDMDIPDEFEAMGYALPRKRPWPSRDNMITRMLSDIGQGEMVSLTYLHEGKEIQKDFEIQMSPRDFFSADKYKDEKLGLTVKNLTYEMCSALRLESNDSGIIIAKVEDGTPAALGRIRTYELIRAVDGEPVDSVDTFEKHIRNAKKAEKESIRLTIEWMGKTRLTDLKFDAKQPGMQNMLKMLPGM